MFEYCKTSFSGPLRGSFSNFFVFRKFLNPSKPKKKIFFYNDSIQFYNNYFFFNHRPEKKLQRYFLSLLETAYFFLENSLKAFSEVILLILLFGVCKPRTRKEAQGRFWHVLFFLRKRLFFKETALKVLVLKRVSCFSFSRSSVEV